MFDWAESAFTTTIMAAILPVYYASVSASSLPENMRTVYWAYTSAIGLGISALISPAFGVLLDLSPNKKRILFSSTVVACIATACLAMTGPGDYILTSVIYLIAFLAFAFGHVAYNGLLMQLASGDDADMLSSAGFALGYLGGGILFLVNIIMIAKWEAIGFASKLSATHWCFISVAIWVVIFTLPLMLWVKEKPLPPGSVAAKFDLRTIWEVYRQLYDTFREIQKFRDLFIFLCAYWLYSDGIGTIFRMATAFGSEVGVDDSSMMLALLAVQFVGFPATFAFGFLAKKIGAKNSLIVTLVTYSAITILGYFMKTTKDFWMLALLVGLVQGGSQALSRSLFTRLVPKDKANEFFGFYLLSERFAGVLGPLLFGVVSQLSGASRNSILFLIAFFVIGIFLLQKVDFIRGQRVAQK